jgi:hypothetical protein
MDCHGVSERLPWLLTGSLSASESEEVRRHLAACAACREELDETRRAAEVFGAHLSTSTILDLAWDRSPSGVEPGLAAAHLQGCVDCREELELARESRRAEAHELTVRRKPSIGFVLPAALAAGLLIGFGLGGLRKPAPAPPDPRVAQLEGESSRLRVLVSELEAAARTARPRINLPVFELMPALVRRGAEESGVDVAIPSGATEVALLLSADGKPGTQASLVIRDAADREVWRTDGLVAVPPGGYVVTVPVEMLPAGRFALRLQPAGGKAVDYAVRVRR